MPSRYELLDSDEARLPEGMTRIGYDADTQVYTYRDDTDGSYWVGEEGNRYGRLHRAGNAGTRQPGQGVPKEVRYEDWRYLSPFFLLVLTVLLATFWFVNSGRHVQTCDMGYERVIVQKGETCWGIAGAHGVSLNAFANTNKGIQCDKLKPGQQVCLPTTKEGKAGGGRINAIP